MQAAPDPAELLADPVAAAGAANLRYVNDDDPGIARRRSGKGFGYRDPEGKPIRDRDEIRRIRSLAIPPAWTEVWICPNLNGHIQATGRDARGRKQYRYHPRWRSVRDDSKYQRTIAFAQALPRIRARVRKDLSRPGLPREKVLATIVALLETTFIRVGNEEYARDNRSYGLTTMLDKHVDVAGSRIRFAFKGKSGKRHEVDVRDRRLARIVKRCDELGGQRLFTYEDENGKPEPIESADVNAYIRDAADGDFTAKDFRTWAGTVLAAVALQAVREFDDDAAGKQNVVRAIESVAKTLGNTPAVCRKCYVHPAVVDAYLDGSMVQVAVQRTEEELASTEDLRPEEVAVLALLRKRLKDGARTAGRTAASAA
ncbi:MAG: DNA topoisomerase IB [Chloroflexi bacterium]|nr:DNA topoisomerase IB [Chloroflexota bacterium]